MNRRYFLGLLKTIGICGLIFPKLFFPGQQKVRFYVAGARFYDPPDELTRDAPVSIIHEMWRPNCIRLSIHAPNGQKLGHVPEKLTRHLESNGIAESRLIKINANGLPWKRYRIETTLKS